MTLIKNGVRHRVRHGIRFASVKPVRGMGFILGRAGSILAEGFFGGDR